MMMMMMMTMMMICREWIHVHAVTECSLHFHGNFPPKGTTTAKEKKEKEASLVPTSLSRSNSLRTGRSSGFSFLQSYTIFFYQFQSAVWWVWAHTAIPPRCTLCAGGIAECLKIYLPAPDHSVFCQKRLCFIVSLCLVTQVSTFP